VKVLAADRSEVGWLVERTGFAPTAGVRAIKAMDAEGVIKGMVAFDCWTENAVQAHMAVDTPIAWRSLLRPAFAYPFEQCGKGIILAAIPAGNARSVRLAKHFGFREMHRVRDGWAAGDDLLLLELRREGCRWLSKERKAA
jgi:L-amino acid N-acyltransferase YncA